MRIVAVVGLVSWLGIATGRAEHAAQYAPLATGPAKLRAVKATARVLGRSVDSDNEMLLVELESADLSPPGRAVVDGAWTAVMEGKSNPTLCIRRPSSADPVKGTFYNLHGLGHATVAARFQAAVPSGLPAVPAADCLRAFGRAVGFGAANSYAGARLEDLATPPKPTSTRDPMTATEADRRNLLGYIMDKPTDLSLDDYLQSARRLWVHAGEKAAVAIKTLSPPAVAPHPWRLMLERFKTAIPTEKLAEAVPAELSYVRARRIDTFFRLLDHVDTWVTPALATTEHAHADRMLARRYLRQLGIERGLLSTLLGPSVLAELAVCTSDAYVREGTDVTVLFRAKDAASRSLLSGALDRMLDGYRAKHADLATRQDRLAGIDMRISSTPDGVVRQHRASVGDLEIISNSAPALERVLQAVQGKRDRLADELAFRYMLARDEGAGDDIFAYLGERFIAGTVSPRQKILEARRVVATSELATPGYAALLFGWMFHRSPRDTEELVQQKLLDRVDLTHGDGAAITFVPGRSARSRWGTLSSLTPLIELAAPELVTKSEAASYRDFATGHEQTWSDYVDPIALRVSAGAVDKGIARWTFDLRVLPVVRTREYPALLRWLGQARFELGRAPDGARAVLGLGKDALLREANGFVSLPGIESLRFDWLGSWSMLGVGDAPAVLAALRSWMRSDLPQPPGHESDDPVGRYRIWDLPMYAGLSVKSASGARGFITELRALVKKSMGDRVTFADVGQHRNVPIGDIRVHERNVDPKRDTHLYYALTNDVLLLCLDRAWMQRLIDGAATGGMAKEAAGGQAGTQLSVDLASPVGGPLWTLLSWVSEKETREYSERLADVATGLFRGAPELTTPESFADLAMAYYGWVPLTPSGQPYLPGAAGAEDRDRGSTLLPRWPKLPVPNSTLTRALEKLTGVRTEISLDDEGVPGSREKDNPSVAAENAQSLHVRVTLQLRD